MLSLLLTAVFASVPFETMMRGTLGDADKAAVQIWCDKISHTASISSIPGAAACDEVEVVNFPPYFVDTGLNGDIDGSLACCRKIATLSFGMTTVKNGVDAERLLASSKDLGGLYIAAYRIAQLGLSSSAQAIAHRALLEFSKHPNPAVFIRAIDTCRVSPAQKSQILGIVLTQDQIVEDACSRAVADVTEQLTSTVQQLRAKTVENTQMQSKIADQERTAERMCQSADTMGKDKKKLEESIATLRSELSKAQTAVARLEAEVKQNTRGASTSQAEIDRLKSVEKRLEAAVTQRDIDLARIQTEYVEAMKRRDAEQTGLRRRIEQDLTVALTAGYEQKLAEQLALQANSYEKRLRVATAELETLRTRNRELERVEAAKEELADRVRAAEGAAAKAHSDKDELSRTLGHVEGQIDEIEKQRDELDERVTRQGAVIQTGMLLLGQIMSSGKGTVPVNALRPLLMGFSGVSPTAAATGKEDVTSSSRKSEDDA